MRYVSFENRFYVTIIGFIKTEAKNSNIKSREKLFFSFFIDYNEDREFYSENKAKKQIEDDNEIIIETIGRTFLSLP